MMEIHYYYYYYYFQNKPAWRTKQMEQVPTSLCLFLHCVCHWVFAGIKTMHLIVVLYRTAIMTLDMVHLIGMLLEVIVIIVKGTYLAKVTFAKELIKTYQHPQNLLP